MAEKLDILNTAISLLIRAALLAARFSGRIRQRYLKRLASRDVSANAKEVLFLKDRVPDNIERRVFVETRITAYRLKIAA